MTYRLPHLASQQQIESWASTYSTRAELPNLVRRLVRATVPTVEELTMPGDEHVDLNGYDGIVSSPLQTPFVPLGRSVWEFGTSGEPQDKANKDYRTRTKNSLGIDKANTTFVFVTPRRWSGAAKWAAKKAALGEWKNVVVRASADLYAALEDSPRTHIWFSEQLGIPSNGVSTLSNWWDRYTAGTRGLITPELLVGGRADAIANLLRALSSTDSAHLWIKAPSADDVLAFVSAAILLADPDTRDDLLERALVVFDPGALSYLDGTEGLLILVPFEESLMRQADLVTGHHVVMHTTGAIEPAITLPAVPIAASQTALRDAGVESERIAQLAKALNKSLPLFKRHITGSASLGLASSASIAPSQLARRVWLLGSWDFAQIGDVKVFDELTNHASASTEPELEQLAGGASPLLTHVSSAWKVFDPIASFGLVAPTITRDDLQAMERIIQSVLGAVDPRLELPREDRWRAAIEGKIRAHSADLRSGLAKTIALLAAQGNDTLVGGTSLRGWAQLMVRALLERANQDRSGWLWESLYDVLGLLAEAAPDQFMDALEIATATGGVLVGRIFEDSDDLMSPTSPHVYLLWALETIAWSPDYFGAAVNLIARLAEMDPGGKLSNRPISTLANLFLPWHPQTGATLASRNNVLSKLCRRSPDRAWELLQALLPEAHASAIEGVGPEFRDWKTAVANKRVTMASYFEGVQHVLALSIEMAAADYSRLPDLVDKLDDLTTTLRAQVLTVFETASKEELPAELNDQIWQELTALIRRHRHYRDADWSLDEDVLDELDAIAAGFRPKRETERVGWLFGHTPELDGVDLRDDYARYEAEVRRRQVEAVERVYQESGLEGLITLSRSVELPWAVGIAAASTDNVAVNLDDVAALLVDHDVSVTRMATSLVGRKLNGDAGALDSLARNHGDEPLIQARILRTIEDLPRAWELAREAGEAVDRHYWAEFEIFGRGEFELVNEAAAQLRRHGRFARALDLLAIYSHRSEVTLDSRLIVDLLNDLIDAEDPERGTLSQYDIAALLEYARNSGEIDTEVLGLLEWRYLPALDSSSSIPALQSLLASSPEFFVQIISYLYRRKGAESNDEKHPENLVRNAWTLLHRWEVVPGSTDRGGEVNEALLLEWVSTARRLLSEAGRLSVGEAHIGQVLAHSKADEEYWPTLPVRNLIENDSSETIDRNFMIGIANSRGIVSRGIGEGGEQERALAEKYEEYAALINDEWPRTARLLRTVAEEYRREAAEQDERAQREQEGFEH